jgi:uncharacterized protein YggE
MRAIWLAAILFCMPWLAAAQADTDTLTITASRIASAVPDQVVIAVDLSAPPEASLDEVPSSLSRINETVASLVRVQQRIATDHRNFQFGFNIVQLQVSAEQQAAQVCAYTALLSYAQTQAQRVAAAAGVRVGPVVGIADAGGVSGAIGYAAPSQWFTTPGFVRSGDFSGLTGFLLAPPAITPACSMTVQFKLLR